MLCFLGLKVVHPVNNRKRYRECLQEIRHFIALQQVESVDNEQMITLFHQEYSFTIVKNPQYLYTTYANLPLLTPDDNQFLDLCFECLMILQQSFPLNIQIDLVTDSDTRDIVSFKQRKQEQLSRRFNANLKGLTETNIDLQLDDVLRYQFISKISYFWPLITILEKTRLLPQKYSLIKQILIMYPVSHLNFQKQVELKRLASDLIAKIKSIQNQFGKGSENVMRMSNISNEKIIEGPVKLQSVIFQLKESFSLERVCLLLNHALGNEEQKQFYSKLESSINTITNKFLNDEYDETMNIGGDFTQLLRSYWNRRGKKWDENIRERVQNKAKDFGCHKSESRSRALNRG